MIRQERPGNPTNHDPIPFPAELRVRFVEKTYPMPDGKKGFCVCASEAQESENPVDQKYRPQEGLEKSHEPCPERRGGGPVVIQGPKEPEYVDDASTAMVVDVLFPVTP